MDRKLTNSECEVIRLLKSPIFTEKQVEETLQALSSVKRQSSVLSTQKKMLEGLLEAVRCITDEGIPTIEESDALLEKLWQSVADTPYDPESECFEEAVLSFPAGTHREELWRWFDERYSKGVAHLIYGYDGVDRTDQIARLLYLSELCDECDSESCAYNEKGVCRFPLVHGRKPAYTDHDGCIDGAVVEHTNRGTEEMQWLK